MVGRRREGGRWSPTERGRWSHTARRQRSREAIPHGLSGGGVLGAALPLFCAALPPSSMTPWPPAKAVAMFQALAVKKGAVVRDKTEVVGIRKEEGGDIMVTTSINAVFRGGKCVVMVDAWATKLVRSITSSLELPIQLASPDVAGLHGDLASPAVAGLLDDLAPSAVVRLPHAPPWPPR